jgi:3-dehydroquinate synthase
MEKLRVRSGSFSYDVVIGRGAWRALRQLDLGKYTSTFVLTEAGLWKQWGREFTRAGTLESPRTIIVPAGEKSKSLRSVERVAGALLADGADRRSLLIAFGGGVIGDLGGFVASTYMRGIDYVQVPTTVVAQVDSAIGGKTAVNVGAMKNLVGTFFAPRLVLSDPTVLTTLGARAFQSGWYEVIKHAIISDAGLFRELETLIDKLTAANARRLGPILARAARVKVDVVSRDEREAGLRRVLNLGHTFGHALEEVTHYRRFLHGEAVGWGTLAATRLAERMGLLELSDASRISALVRRAGKLPRIDDLSLDDVMGLLPRDKKAVGGRIHWVLPERIGKVRVVADVPQAEVESAFRDIQQTFRHE